MKKTVLTTILVAATLVAYVPSKSSGQAQPSEKILILYDSTHSDYGKLGQVYAIMLRNLLGHFYLDADLKPVETYTTGQIENYRATFYMGAIYDNPLPAAFLADAAQTQKTLVWFKYNLWQFAWDPQYQFGTKFGYNFLTLRGMNSSPSPSNPAPGFFDTINYKNKAMAKYYSYDSASNSIKADPDFGLTQITDATKATAVVSATNSGTQEVAPYIIRSGNFWYFADMPLSFIHPRDRYLVLCDILHDILGINHPELHRAMVRLEDVSALVDPASMKKLTDYLYKSRIPFSIATIPFYRDPLGKYNGGEPMEVHLSEAPDLLSSLNYAKTRGGTVLMHGYTHQYNDVPNLHTGVSADDFEFWYATENRPVDEDSESWAANRLSLGLAELQANGFSTDVFEPPHYQASPKAYKAIKGLFNNTYQRVVYYTSETPNLNATGPGRDFAAGMFYPYIIGSDYYGMRIMPENLGNVEYNICEIDPTSCFDYTWRDLLTNAEFGLVVRDGFASFFFHPFWIEQDLAYLNGYTDFTNLVKGITALGYKWVGMKDLVITATSISPTSGARAGGTSMTITGRGFEPGATVKIGGNLATNVVVVSPTSITCRTPAGARGRADVTVTNGDARSSTLAGAYTYK